MANEAYVRSSLRIQVGELDYQSRPVAFRADVSAAEGPTPGLVYATLDGVDIVLSGLTTPGLCWMQNLDEDNYVTYGIWDPDISKYYPLGELLPGECYALRLSRSFGQEFTGTGTSVLDSNQRLRIKGTNATCKVRVDAFGK
jgi:hypothetical protein